MSYITADLRIAFDTDKAITKEQFDNFEKKIREVIHEEWEISLLETTSKIGFDALTLNTIIIDGITCDF